MAALLSVDRPARTREVEGPRGLTDQRESNEHAEGCQKMAPDEAPTHVTGATSLPNRPPHTPPGYQCPAAPGISWKRSRHYLAGFDHGADVARVRDVVQGVGVEEHDVRDLAHLDGSVARLRS